MIPDRAAWLPDEVPAETNAIRRNKHAGRLVLRSEAAPLLRRVAPCGTTDFVRRLENMLGRPCPAAKTRSKSKGPKGNNTIRTEMRSLFRK